MMNGYSFSLYYYVMVGFGKTGEEWSLIHRMTALWRRTPWQSSWRIVLCARCCLIIPYSLIYFIKVKKQTADKTYLTLICLFSMCVCMCV